jgi:ABC-type proline/glycine betaine transport system ATPase subunit
MSSASDPGYAPSLISCLRQSRVILRTQGAVVNDLKSHYDLSGPLSDTQGEAKANITLAFRHVEDAIMRLGKAIQVLDGGVIVDRPSRPEHTVIEPKNTFARSTADLDNPDNADLRRIYNNYDPTKHGYPAKGDDMRRTISANPDTESLESRVVNTCQPPSITQQVCESESKKLKRAEEKIQLQSALNNFLRLKTQVLAAALEHRKLNGPLSPIDEERGGRLLDSLAKALATKDLPSTQH